ncbi:ABC transporter substrate-binding protein [Rhodococcus sp. O3]|uniref:ABC transporter substrate-binding protein n=1 Tax=Rhodococcus sp. O3 TaxID=3404919 RepID=UPI003B66BD74
MGMPRLRPIFVTTLALATVSALVACGSDDDSTTSVAEGDGAFPVTVEHAYGSTTIAAAPGRVVTIGFNDLDFVLALGSTPVATREFTGYDYRQRPWADRYPEAAQLPEVGGMELDFEKLAEAAPDLLVGTYSLLEEDDYETVSSIAPTVGELRGSGGGPASWEDQLTTIGRSLGKSNEAQQLLESVRADFADATAANPQFAGRTAAVAMVLDGGFYILEADDPRNRFFTDLGFVTPAEVGAVGPERLDLLDQQNLIVLGATKEQLTADPLFAALDVVKNDRTVYLGEFGTDAPAALGFASPLSLPYLLDVTVPALAAATDEDPATVVPAIG